MDKTKLGDLMKSFQAVSDIALPADGYNVLQLDGNAFHTFTRGFERPFDARFVDAMNQVAIEVASYIPSARFAYVQSDEISVFIRRKNEEDDPFFNFRVQKIVSLTAARASVKMSQLYPEKNGAFFDARFFTLPDADLAAKHFIWRQRDCTKNSISSVAQARFSSKELHGKNSLMMREMLVEVGDAWENYPTELKHGRLIVKRPSVRNVTFTHKRTNQEQTIVVEADQWVAEPAERFEESRILDTLI